MGGYIFLFVPNPSSPETQGPSRRPISCPSYLYRLSRCVVNRLLRAAFLGRSGESLSPETPLVLPTGRGGSGPEGIEETSFPFEGADEDQFGVFRDGQMRIRIDGKRAFPFDGGDGAIGELADS